MFKMIVCLLVVLVCLAVPSGQAQAETIFVGIPNIKVEADEKGTRRSALTGEEAQQYACKIIQRDGKYYWASRQNKLMTKVQSGFWLYFISVDGAGYVKVLSVPSVQGVDDGAGYMEHLPITLAHVTYWGKCVTGIGAPMVAKPLN